MVQDVHESYDDNVWIWTFKWLDIDMDIDVCRDVDIEQFDVVALLAMTVMSTSKLT